MWPITYEDRLKLYHYHEEGISSVLEKKVKTWVKNNKEVASGCVVILDGKAEKNRQEYVKWKEKGQEQTCIVVLYSFV